MTNNVIQETSLYIWSKKCSILFGILQYLIYSCHIVIGKWQQSLLFVETLLFSIMSAHIESFWMSEFIRFLCRGTNLLSTIETIRPCWAFYFLEHINIKFIVCSCPSEISSNLMDGLIKNDGFECVNLAK